ncbi:hypothetical protein KBC31_01725 [Candidatus Saccharibacteria bacterium]|jgi:hypothetical protein|nr:hypothetical protein [Candidatus Saccharibacteria bacterium]
MVDKPVKPRLILLDMDRTIFDTDQHFTDFTDITAREYGLDASLLRNHEHQLTKNPGPYSPIDDIRYNNILPGVDANQLLENIEKQMLANDHDYLYPDVAEFIVRQQKQGNEVVIVTVGTHEYQLHKQRLSPELHALPIMVTRRTKSELLGAALEFKQDYIKLWYEGISVRAEKVTLVDDRTGTFDGKLPTDARFDGYLLKRPGVGHTEELVDNSLATQIISLSQFV